jgi:adenylosuccinate synthase
VDGYRKRYGDLLQYDVEEEVARFKQYAEDLRPFAIDEIPLLRSAKNSGAIVAVEGAQALMRKSKMKLKIDYSTANAAFAVDISYGTYPMVTSSHCSGKF